MIEIKENHWTHLLRCTYSSTGWQAAASADAFEARPFCSWRRPGARPGSSERLHSFISRMRPIS